MRNLILIITVFGLTSSVFADERCRVDRRYGGYDIECREKNNVLNEMMRLGRESVSPLEARRNRQRENAANAMTMQQHQMQQQLLQLEIQKRQLELERLRQESANESTNTDSNSKNVLNTPSKYCNFVARGAGAVAESRDKESWESIQKKLAEKLEHKESPLALKLILIEELQTAYHSKETPIDAFFQAEKNCLEKIAELTK